MRFDADLMPALRDEDLLRARLFAVLGASTALGDHLVANPGEWRTLRDRDRESDDSEAPSDVLTLRLAYRRELLRIAAADLTGAADVDDTMTALSPPRRRHAEAGHSGSPAADRDTRLAVIAMGKCGGGELNYVSDVDVIFVCATTRTWPRPRRSPSS